MHTVSYAYYYLTFFTMETTTVGVFENRENAEMTIHDLRNLGVTDADISYAYSTPEGTVNVDGDGNKAGAGAASGATTGAVVGALAGLAVANGILPGLGTLFVAGPLATALGFTGAAATTVAGAATGAAAGGLLGALVGLGISDSDAQKYVERVRKGAVLVSARSMNALAMRDIFAKHGAEEIREYSKV
jgi:uncharacterized membrane protein